MQLIAREQIVAQARSWVGVPFAHMGRSREKGVDCAGLVHGVYASLYGEVAEIGSYPAAPNPNHVLAMLDRYGVKSEKTQEQLQPGDVAALWGVDPGTPRHVAIIGWDPMCRRITMIHAFSKPKKVVEHSWDQFWAKRYVCAYEFPNAAPWEG